MLYLLSVFSFILSSGQNNGQVHNFLFFYDLNSLIIILIITILHLLNFSYVDL